MLQLTDRSVFHYSMKIILLCRVTLIHLIKGKRKRIEFSYNCVHLEPPRSLLSGCTWQSDNGLSDTSLQLPHYPLLLLRTVGSPCYKHMGEGRRTTWRFYIHIIFFSYIQPKASWVKCTSKVLSLVHNIVHYTVHIYTFKFVLTF